MPEDYHPLVNAIDKVQLEEMFRNLKIIIDRAVDKLPSHRQFLNAE